MERAEREDDRIDLGEGEHSLFIGFLCSRGARRVVPWGNRSISGQAQGPAPTRNQ
jgi:hypothetical protein